MIIPVAQLAPGDLLLASGKREFNSRVVAIDPCQPGQPVSGPRGGSYRLTASGAASYLRVTLSNGKRPLLKAAGHAAIYRAEAS